MHNGWTKTDYLGGIMRLAKMKVVHSCGDNLWVRSWRFVGCTTSKQLGSNVLFHSQLEKGEGL